MTRTRSPRAFSRRREPEPAADVISPGLHAQLREAFDQAKETLRVRPLTRHKNLLEMSEPWPTRTLTASAPPSDVAERLRAGFVASRRWQEWNRLEAEREAAEAVPPAATKSPADLAREVLDRARARPGDNIAPTPPPDDGVDHPDRGRTGEGPFEGARRTQARREAARSGVASGVLAALGAEAVSCITASGRLDTEALVASGYARRETSGDKRDGVSVQGRRLIVRQAAAAQEALADLARRFPRPRSTAVERPLVAAVQPEVRTMVPASAVDLPAGDSRLAVLAGFSRGVVERLAMHAEREATLEHESGAVARLADRVEQLAARPAPPAPNIVVHVPVQPAPVVNVAAAPPADVHVHVPAQAKPRGVRVQTDTQGNKTYVPIDAA